MGIYIKGMELPKMPDNIGQGEKIPYIDVRIFADGDAVVTKGTRPYYDKYAAVELPSQLMAEWINVNDHLPHAIAGESDDVLTLNRFGEYNILYFDGNQWRKRNGEPYNLNLNPLFEVMYWMLPGAPDGFRPWRREPPKED